ncbi:MAG TPA: FAD-binding protein [Anaerolineae bacterium]|nr:FAD-binding protein [Anaerolineae bacterium]HIQ04312.1 FAD-binding protein [Anaerolineae bacterium]
MKAKRTELAIVGAGPAGLAAALEAALGGAKAIVIDAYTQPGGHYFKQLPPALQRVPSTEDARESELRSLLASLAKSSVEVLSGTIVWGIFQDEGPSFANRVDVVNAPTGPQTDEQEHKVRFTLYLQGPHQTQCIEAEYLILATGAYDRPVPFPGWTLPGVITPGAAQMLLKGQGILPGKRVLVAGTGPLLLAVGASLAEAGAQVVGVLDTAPLWEDWQAMPWALWGQWARLWEAWRYWRTLRIHAVPVLFGHAVFQALGEQEVHAAVIGRVDAEGHPLWGTERTVAVDTICVGFGFLPSIALSQHLGCRHFYNPELDAYVPQHTDTLETTTPGVFVAGDMTGVGGKPLSMLQGRVAGLTIMEKLGYLPPDAVKARVRKLRSQIRRERRFARLLRKRFRVRPGLLDLIRDDTVICRCERVTAGQIKEAVADGARDVRGVKIRTRAGMGSCQGRYCSLMVGDLIARETGRAREEVGFIAVRPPVIPVLINNLFVCE